MRVLDLFSGIGGMSLGLERAGFETVAFCEIDPFARSVLARHWPAVPCHQDIATIDPGTIEADVICGGFPCQPYSTASRGRRVAPDLWPEMQRVIAALRPKIVIAENVAHEPIERAAAFCRGLGLSCHPRRISAADIGGDHRRDRWWAVAHPYEDSELQGALNAEVARLRSLRVRLWGASAFRAAVRAADGVPDRMDRRAVKALGNAVLPQIPEAIGRALRVASSGHHQEPRRPEGRRFPRRNR